MTIDELIKELEIIKYKRGGQTTVFFECSASGEYLEIQDITYYDASKLEPSGVLLS